MADITYMTVTGLWSHVVDDGIVDGDPNPDTVHPTGKVVFAPKPSNTGFVTAGAAGESESVTLAEVPALVAAGVLTDLQGNEGVRLAATIGGNPVRWVAQPTLMWGKKTLPSKSVTFDPPTVGTTLHLNDLFDDIGPQSPLVTTEVKAYRDQAVAARDAAQQIADEVAAGVVPDAGVAARIIDPDSETRTALDTTYAPKWLPTTAYTAGALVMLPAPVNGPGTRTTSGTSRASFDATEQGLWTKTGGGVSSWDDLQDKPPVVSSINGLTPNGSGVLTFATASAAALERNRIASRMTVLPPQGRQVVIETLVNALMAAGIWDKLDGLYLLAAHTEQAAKINWRGGPAQDLVNVNGCLFSTNSGITGDGSTSYLDPLLPGNAGDNYAQNSAFMASWVIGNLASNTAMDISGAGGAYINPRTASNVIAVRANNSSSAVYSQATATSAGLTAWSRSASTGFTVYRDGAVHGTSTSVSDAFNSTPIYLLRNASSYSGRKIAFAAWGGALTDAQQSSLYSAVRTYLLAVGAITA
ncbi:hypothetical protein SEA_MURP_31 [Gordonia phage Murp]|nr:hypothetical protein SEA_MURP_31 [Gordonia phage Murp]